VTEGYKDTSDEEEEGDGAASAIANGTGAGAGAGAAGEAGKGKADRKAPIGGRLIINKEFMTIGTIQCPSLSNSQAPLATTPQEEHIISTIQRSGFDRNVHSRMPLVPTPAPLQALACV
jgi:hypothetical protein